MFNAYSVGATLKLTDLVTPQLLKLSREFAKLDATLTRANAKLKQLGAQAPGVRLVANAMQSVGQHASMGAKQTGLLDKALGRVGGQAAAMQATAAATQQIGFAAQRSSNQMAALHRQMLATQAAGRRAAIAPAIHPPGYVHHGRRGGAMIGGRLSLSTAGVGVGAVGLGAGSQAGMVGAGAAIAGGLGLAAVYKGPIQAAKEGQLAAARFRTMGLGEAVNKEAEAFARGTRAFGVTSTQLHDTLGESVSFFAGMKDGMRFAKELAPTIARLNNANMGLFGTSVAQAANETQALIKAADIRGKTETPEMLRAELNMYQKFRTASRGAIKPSDILNFAKYSGTAGKGLDEEGMYESLSLFQESGGARTGTAMRGLYQNLVAGRTTKGAMAAVQALGLGRIEQEKIGTVGGKDATQNKLILNSDFEKRLIVNQSAAIREFILPAIAKKFGQDKADDDRFVLKIINSLASNSVASGQAGTMGTQQLQILRDARFAKGAQGMDETIATFERTMSGQQQNAIARWNDAMNNLGTVILPVATDAVMGLSRGIESLAKWTQENEGKAKTLMWGFIGLAGSMAFGGTVLLLTAAFKGLAALFTAGGVLSTGVMGATAMLAGKGGLAAAIGALTGPIGIAVLALGTLGGAIYALRGMKQGEVDASRMAGSVPAQLTGDAAARIGAMGGIANPKPLPKPKYEFWHKDSLFGKVFGSTPTDTSTSGLRPLAPTIMPREGSPFVPSGRSTVIESHVSVNVDGRKMAEAVSREQGREASRPWPAGQRFDASRSLLPPGAVTGGGR